MKDFGARKLYVAFRHQTYRTKDLTIQTLNLFLIFLLRLICSSLYSWWEIGWKVSLLLYDWSWSRALYSIFATKEYTDYY